MLRTLSNFAHNIIKIGVKDTVQFLSKLEFKQIGKTRLFLGHLLQNTNSKHVILLHSYFNQLFKQIYAWLIHKYEEKSRCKASILTNSSKSTSFSFQFSFFLLLSSPSSSFFFLLPWSFFPLLLVGLAEWVSEGDKGTKTINAQSNLALKYLRYLTLKHVVFSLPCVKCRFNCSNNFLDYTIPYAQGTTLSKLF